MIKKEKRKTKEAVLHRQVVLCIQSSTFFIILHLTLNESHTNKQTPMLTPIDSSPPPPTPCPIPHSPPPHAHSPPHPTHPSLLNAAYSRPYLLSFIAHSLHLFNLCTPILATFHLLHTPVTFLCSFILTFHLLHTENLNPAPNSS